MSIIDTHSHIYSEEFDNDIDNVILRAKGKGLSHILLPNIDENSIDRMHRLCEQYPGYCIPMMGLHPTSVNNYWKSVLERMKPLFDQRKYIAVGEIGIDLYWDKTYEKEQKQSFIEQLKWAKEFSLPVAIHMRSAHQETMECLRKMGSDGLSGVFHSFGGTEDELDEIMSFPNFYVGINGVVTFKNSALRETLKRADLSRIIVETDSPYLAPVPFRGKRNESSYIAIVIDTLAKVFGTSAEEMAEITSKNAKRLFLI
ncbi:MAG: putative deoxyribonuclease [Bacteroidetes bacterium]|jgi:TatD DNase family protein|nr:putative deoxyribonuclease [Bacteroidota bacterium]